MYNIYTHTILWFFKHYIYLRKVFIQSNVSKSGILFTRAAKNMAHLGLVHFVANPYGLSGIESV
jgi:hypothetical protein